jgi:hypothetical protein
LLPSACAIALRIGVVISVNALRPISTWPHEMLKARPSSAHDLVGPVSLDILKLSGWLFGAHWRGRET